MNNTDFNNSIALLRAAHKAWLGAADFRRQRQRNKKFTYGNQWDDIVFDEEGNPVPEWKALADNGREPLSNNMIRQLVKCVVGRYRNIAKNHTTDNPWLESTLAQNHAAEIDSRAIEEFLISGCCIQKVGVARHLNEWVIDISNINPNRFFVNAFIDPRGNDINLIGQIHDLSPAELIMLLADGNRDKAAWIRSLYNTENMSRANTVRQSLGSDFCSDTDFFFGPSDKCRIFEIWSLEMTERIRTHDCTSGELIEWDVAEFNALPNRKRNGFSPSNCDWEIRQVWRCRWITPMGDIVAEYDSPFAHQSHPYILKLYPLTDGEVHSFVEDVIDQQKHINRLIVTANHVMNSSAKGVLLYPSDALPPGYSWDQIKKMWRSPDGIIPFDSADKSPQQMLTNGTNQGVYQLLDLEMRLFNTVSGVSEALQGHNIGAGVGAELYNRQTDNATIALCDIFDSFRDFIDMRNHKLAML